MYKKILILMLFILTLNLSFGADVELNAHVYKDYTIFNYIFTFNENETINKFSLEKPQDATIDYIVDQNGPIQYEIAGDYIILKPEKTENNVFLLRLKTKSISEEIKKTESFRSYQDFNFEIEKFIFKVTLKENFGDIINVFPENSSITGKEKIEWNSINLEKNSLYVINLKKEEIISEEETTGNYSEFILIGIGIGTILIILLILFFIYPRYLKKYLKKEEIISEEEITFIGEKKSEKKTEKKINKSKEEKTDEKINKFEEIIEKHLTENEKSIVQLIKEEEGITQNDILNYIPSLTKSNLSKIISKLHGKRILKRIKVGKINNIYLGDKLNPTVTKEKKTDEEEEEY